MGTRLLCSSATSGGVLVYTGSISDKSFCAAAGGKLRGTETQLVMADSRIVGNVVQPLARSVVELSTTDVDANNINELTASGESIFSTSSSTQQRGQLEKQQENKENSNGITFPVESGSGSISAVSFVPSCSRSGLCLVNVYHIWTGPHEQ